MAYQLFDLDEKGLNGARIRLGGKTIRISKHLSSHFSPQRKAVHVVATGKDTVAHADDHWGYDGLVLE